MTNAELIKALRYCPSHGCGRCVAVDANGVCTLHGVVGIMNSAADALEAAEKRIAELERILKAVQENSGINFRLWQEAETQMPKEGEWIDGDARKVTARCSVCGHLRLGNGAKWANMYVPFCEICGAKMKGEQE